DRRGLRQEGRGASGPEGRLAAAAAEGTREVRPFAGLEQDHEDQDEGDGNVQQDEQEGQDVHRSPTLNHSRGAASRSVPGRLRGSVGGKTGRTRAVPRPNKRRPRKPRRPPGATIGNSW